MTTADQQIRAAFLAGERVVLRPLEHTDLVGPYLDWINDQAADLYTDHARFPWNVDDLTRYYEGLRGARNAIHLAVTDRIDGRHVGNVSIHDINWIARRGEFAILIGDTKRQGRGLGHEASTLLIDHAFRRLALNRIWLGVRTDHQAAIALYRSLGFRDEGVLRAHTVRDGIPADASVMGLLRSEWLEGGERKTGG